jgi:hypothetical protein
MANLTQARASDPERHASRIPLTTISRMRGDNQ